MINALVSRWTGLLFDRQLKSGSTRTFKNVLYLVASLECIYWILHYQRYFGASSIVYRTAAAMNSWRDGAYILYYHPALAPFFLGAVLAISAAALIYDRRWMLSDSVLFILVVNLHFSVYPGMSSGNFLVNQFLLFAILLSGKPVTAEGWRKDARLFLHNCGVIAVMVQVCLLYLISALLKLQDESWTSGTALEHVSRLRHFSGYLLPENFHFTGALAKLLAWLVLGFQLLFPLLVWWSRAKKPLLLFGTAVHLYIAFGMGLTLFGLVMIAGYILFWPPPRWAE